MIRTCGDIGLLTGPHHTSFSELSSLTMRLSRGERPVFDPEYAVKAPVDVIAEPVSYTRASSYKAATEGLAIWLSHNGEILKDRRMERTDNRDAIVINVSDFVELFFDLCMLTLWSAADLGQPEYPLPVGLDIMDVDAYATPVGWRLVLLTLLGLIILRELEW